MKKKKKSKFRFIKNTLLILLIGVSGYMLYSLINQGFLDLFNSIGITNVYLQYSIILVILFVSIIFLGGNIKKSIREMIC
jgi:glucose uptake protein GlcU